MFIALLVPSLKRSRKIALVAVLGAVINWVLLAVVKISGGWSIVTATVVASAIGALVYKGGTD
jgi:predicted branched-subunit amino acid permease